MMEEDSIKKLFASYYEISKLCAEEVIKGLKDEDQKSLLGDLDLAVRQVSALENKTRRESQALSAIEHEMNETNHVNEFGDIDEMLKEKLAQSNSSVSWTEGLQNYQAHVDKVFNSLELEGMIIASSDNHIDPYSKKPIQHPVKTKFCNHTFDKTSVMEILSTKGKNGRLRCPYMGCNQHFTAKDLVNMDQEEDSD